MNVAWFEAAVARAEAAAAGVGEYHYPTVEYDYEYLIGPMYDDGSFSYNVITTKALYNIRHDDQRIIRDEPDPDDIFRGRLYLKNSLQSWM